jgi:hypothetical protein
LGVYAKRGNRQAISIMMTQAHSGVHKRQAVVIDFLGPFAGNDEKAFELLRSLAQDKDLRSRAAAVDALGFTVAEGGKYSHAALDELLRVADSSDLETRKHAIQALCHSTRYFSEIIPTLENAFQSEKLSEICIMGIEHIINERDHPPNSSPKQLLPPGFSPLNEVRSKYSVIRFMAVSTLDSSRDDELTALLGALHDNNPRVRQRAESNIGVQSNPKYVAAALKALQSSAAETDPDVRKALLPVLANAAFQKDRSALEGLIRLGEDRDPSIRAQAIGTFFWGHVGFRLNDFSEVEKALYRAFRDGDQQVSSTAQQVMETFTVQNGGLKSINPAKSIKGVEPGERFMAVLKADPKSPAGIAVLVEATRDADARIRHRAVTELRKVGADSLDAEAVLRALDSASRDRDTDTQQAAVQAKSALEAAIKKQAGK